MRSKRRSPAHHFALKPDERSSPAAGEDRSSTPDRSATDTEFRHLAHGETYTFTPNN